MFERIHHFERNARTQDFLRMRVHGHDQRPKTVGARERKRPKDNPAMSDMNAVKYADTNGGFGRNFERF